MARFYRGKDTADLVKGRREGKDVSNIWICIILVGFPESFGCHGGVYIFVHQ